MTAKKELGIPYEPPGSPWQDATTTGTPFVFGASVPVLPYVFLTTTAGLYVSVVLTLGALFVMGVVKARLAGTPLPNALGISAPAG